ncbi:MAG: hypothetical protein ABIH23_01035, partial [bacterium]
GDGYHGPSPPIDVLKELGIISLNHREDGVHILLERRQGNPPQLQNLLRALQDVGIVPTAASSIARLEQFRNMEENLVPVIAT